MNATNATVGVAQKSNRYLGPARPGKVWATDAQANIDSFRANLARIEARGSVPDGPADGERKAIASEVERMLDRAASAADGTYPRYAGFRSWWSGTSTEAAYKYLHYAEAHLARLFDAADIRAELPDAVRRATASLAADDLTTLAARRALAAGEGPSAYTAEQLSVLIKLSHESADRQRSRLRMFRNVTLVCCLMALVLATGFALIAAINPTFVTLCFSATTTACPVGGSASRWDVPVVATLGCIGGALSSIVFIRNLYSNSTPYNVAVPLALLKPPTGALAAVVGLMMVAGDFVPGFSAIDKPAQILAYALVFGFAQQLLTGMLDRKAKSLIANVPSKVKDELGPDGGRADRA